MSNTSHNKQNKLISEYEALIKFEKLISDILTSLVGLPFYKIDQGVELSLKKIGKYCQACRVSMIFISEDKNESTLAYEWQLKKNNTAALKYLDTSIISFDYFINRLSKLKPIVLEKPSDLPKKAKIEQDWQNTKGFYPTLYYPLVHNK